MSEKVKNTVDFQKKACRQLSATDRVHLRRSKPLINKMCAALEQALLKYDRRRRVK